jgi:hypothetical protein
MYQENLNLGITHALLSFICIGSPTIARTTSTIFGAVELGEDGARLTTTNYVRIIIIIIIGDGMVGIASSHDSRNRQFQS